MKTIKKPAKPKKVAPDKLTFEVIFRPMRITTEIIRQPDRKVKFLTKITVSAPGYLDGSAIFAGKYNAKQAFAEFTKNPAMFGYDEPVFSRNAIDVYLGDLLVARALLHGTREITVEEAADLLRTKPDLFTRERGHETAKLLNLVA